MGWTKEDYEQVSRKIMDMEEKEGPVMSDKEWLRRIWNGGPELQGVLPESPWVWDRRRGAEWNRRMEKQTAAMGLGALAPLLFKPQEELKEWEINQVTRLLRLAEKHGFTQERLKEFKERFYEPRFNPGKFFVESAKDSEQSRGGGDK